MAIINKDFRLKNGLVVEGTNATVNGYDILTKNSASDTYILNLVGGVAYITSVGTNLSVTDEQLSIDLIGLAEDLAGSRLYTDGSTLNVDGEGLYDDFVSNGMAKTSDISTALNDYTTTANLDTTVGGYGYLKNADLPTMYTDADAVNAISAKLGTGIEYSGTAFDVQLGTGLTANGSNQIEIDRNTVDGWYDESGAAGAVASDLSDHMNDTSAHGVAGDIVGTTDVQTLANKTIDGALGFDVNGSQIYDFGTNLVVKGDTDLTLQTNSGDIILNPDGHAYVGSASAGNEIATNSYVDNAVSGLNWKQAVNLLYDDPTPTLSGDTLTPLIIDQHSVLTADDNGYRILVANGNDAGIYVFNQSGPTWTLTRTEDADTYQELIGAAVYVMEGTQYGSTSWVQGNHYVTDFTGQDWTQFSGQGSVTAGSGITVDGLEVSINRSTVDNWYDAAGDAADAEQNAKDYADSLASNYDPAGSAQGAYDNAVSAANTYTDQQIGTLDTGYTVRGQINLAESNANSYTDTQLGSYTPTSSLESTIDGYGFAYTSEIPTSTDGVSEGINNLYFTDSRAKSSAMSLLTSASVSNITFADDGSGGLIVTAENGVSDSTTDDLTEGENNLYFTDQRVVDAVNNSTITPAAVEINNYRKEEATQQYVASASTIDVHTFSYPYESAKYLVRVVGFVGGIKHSQVSEILVTIDGNKNIAITEYGMVCTDTSPLASFSARAWTGSSDFTSLTATTAVNGCEIIAAATMLSWAD